LYPLTDHVELWSTLVVGNDKTYILSNINDCELYFPREKLLNRKDTSILPHELSTFFDAIWDRTLIGTQLQFYMVWMGRVYFVNTYPFRNGKGKVIGAIMFIRPFDPSSTNKNVVMDMGIGTPSRGSLEKIVPSVNTNDEAHRKQ
jgi:hypothetical protein